MPRSRHAMLVLLAVVATSHAGTGDHDVSSIRERLRVFHDHKGHYLAFATMPRKRGEMVTITAFYGDGKTLRAQATPGAVESASVFDDRGEVLAAKWSVLDPRTTSSLELTNGQVIVSCGERRTTLTEVTDGKVLAKAAFKEKLWDRFAYLLARDDGTTYYYVDLPGVSNTTDYRVYAGKRGAMKRLKLLDVATDAAGIVLITPTGTLRVVYGKGQHVRTLSWAKPKKSSANATTLIDIPLGASTQELIYGDLGVYTGQRFGTPCDDL